MPYYGPGNWGGLPEFGLTEALGKKTGLYKPNESSVVNAVQKSGGDPTDYGYGTTGGDAPKVFNTSPNEVYYPVETKDSGSSSSDSGGSSQPSDSRMKNDGIWTTVGDQRFRSESEAQKYLAERDAAEERTRNAIKASYEPIFDYYDKAPGRLQQTAESQKGYIGEQFGNLQRGIGETKQHGLESLSRSRERITENKATTLRDLAQNLRDTFRAGNMYLGTRGASDSSATNQMSFALQKAANRNVADVNKQVMQQYGDVDQRVSDVEYQANKALNDAEQWKATQLVGVTNWLNQALDEVSKQKAMAKGEEKTALANLEQSLFQQASDRLAQIDAAMLQYKMNVQQMAQQEVQNIGQYQSRMNEQAAYEAPKIAYNQLQTPTGPSTNRATFSPYARPYTSDEDWRIQQGYNPGYA